MKYLRGESFKKFPPQTKKFLKGRKDAYVAGMVAKFGRAKNLGTTKFEGQNGMCFTSWEIYRLEGKLRSEGCNGLENGDRKTIYNKDFKRVCHVTGLGVETNFRPLESKETNGSGRALDERLTAHFWLVEVLSLLNNLCSSWFFLDSLWDLVCKKFWTAWRWCRNGMEDADELTSLVVTFGFVKFNGN